MTAEGDFTFSQKKKENLKRYIMEGGFLLMDDCVYDEGGGDIFYKSAYKLLEELFGIGSVKQIPNNHEVFHNVFNLGKTGLPYVGWGKNYCARGVFVEDRLAVFLSSTDLHCGWIDRSGMVFGKKGHRPHNRHGYEETIQMGINIIMYALTH